MRSFAFINTAIRLEMNIGTSLFSISEKWRLDIVLRFERSGFADLENGGNQATKARLWRPVRGARRRSSARLVARGLHRDWGGRASRLAPPMVAALT
jgi:hypothetical protein